MRPIAQELLISASRTHRSPNYDVTSSSTIVESFRRQGADPVVTLAAMAQGFGPGWSGEDVCQLALQSLRTEFVEAQEGQELGNVLRAGLMAANEAVCERAISYQAVPQIGVWLMVVVISGGRCLLAQIGGGIAFSQSKELGLQRVRPGLLARQRDTYLGQNPELKLSPSAGGMVWVDIKSAAQVLLTNNKLGHLLPQDQISRALSRLDLEAAADRLIKASHTKDFEGEAVLLLVQMPGAGGRVARSLPRFGRFALAGMLVLAVAAVLWQSWPSEREPTPEDEIALVLSPTATPAQAAATVAPTDLPPPTAEPTKTRAPTVTAVVQLSSTPTFTPLPPTPTPTPTETNTPTPRPPTSTLTPAPSPTIPVGPVLIGGRVVVAYTEGLGASLRDGPGTRFERLLVLPDGAQLTVVAGPEPGLEGEEELTWWQLRTDDGIEGWVVSRYLQGVAQQ